MFCISYSLCDAQSMLYCAHTVLWNLQSAQQDYNCV